MQGGTFKGGDCAPSTCINEPPTAAIVASSTSGVAPLSVTFNAAQSTDPEGDALTYSWDFGDGSADRSGMIIEHEYDEPGTYIAVLTVTDSENLNDTASAQITVHQGITGACCLGDGSCREYTRRECEQRGGDFMGEAVPCNTGDGTCCGAGGVCGVALTLGGLISKRRRIAKWKVEQSRRQNPA